MSVSEDQVPTIERALMASIKRLKALVNHLLHDGNLAEATAAIRKMEAVEAAIMEAVEANYDNVVGTSAAIAGTSAASVGTSAATVGTSVDCCVPPDSTA